MNFDFSEDQYSLRDAIRKFLVKESPLRVAREVLEKRQTHSVPVWQGLSEMGLTTLMLPENCGGHGLGALELCVAAEEIGRQLSPVPLSSTLYLAAQALLLGADNAQQERWLSQIADGKIATLAAPLDGKQRKLPDFDGKVLNGEAALVPDALCASMAVILASNSQGQPCWVIADCDTHVAGQALDTLDPSRPWGRLNFQDAPAEPLNAVDDALDLLDQIRQRAATLLAFEQLGAADAIIEISTEFARERTTFGRAIGSYQGIKHKLVDLYSASQMARVHCYYAAWALESGNEQLPAASAGARVAASRALSLAAQESIQIHGGMGYTWELDCHLFYRRARQLAIMLGSEAVWSERLVQSLESQARNAA